MSYEKIDVKNFRIQIMANSIRKKYRDPIFRLEIQIIDF